MSHDHSETLPESTYPSLVPPQFDSQIPAYLLNGASEQDKHIMSQLSVMSQISAWSIKAHISTMESVRKTNGRLIRAEEDIKDLKSDRKSIKVGWKVVTAIVSGVIAVVTLAVSIYQALHGA